MIDPTFHRFAKRGWRRSRKGNWYKRLNEGSIITLFHHYDGFKFCILCTDDVPQFSSTTFPSLLSAKLAAYKHFEEYLAGEYLNHA